MFCVSFFWESNIEHQTPNTKHQTQNMPDQAFLKRLMEAFKIEAAEHIQAMSSGLLELESISEAEKQAAIVETIFREAHSLKGASRSVNMMEIETICQAIENVFAVWKNKGSVMASPEAFDTLHSAVDIVSMLLSSPQKGEISISEIVEQIEQVAQSASTAQALQAVPPAVEEPLVEVLPEPEQEAVPVAPQTPPLFAPPTPQAPPEEPVLSTAKEEKKEVPVPVETQKEESLPPPPEASGVTRRTGQISPATPTAPKAQERLTLSDTVRISTARLDSILLQAEEMLAVKLAIEQHASDLREVLAFFDSYRQEWDKVSPEVRASRQILSQEKESGNELLGRIRTQFGPVLDFLEQNSTSITSLEDKLKAVAKSVELSRRSVGGMITGLLDSVKDVLMLPFSSLLQLFPKLVRDLSRDRGKQIELIIKGSEVEIDRRILEELKDPLIHLVRNSVDHGVERPEERKRLNKTPRGKMTISTTQLGSSKIEILVSDDGGGIDTERTRQKAVDNGILSEKEAAQMGEQEAVMLIFHSGLSTSPLITDISGRGLGMAIVREKVEKLGGLLSVDTALNKGTTFRIVLPVTLATFRGVIVEANGQMFVVPTTNVEQVVRITPSLIKTVENRNTISLDDRAISLVRLADVLELPVRDQEEESSDFVTVMLLGTAEKRIAFSIDRVINEQEVLVKSLGKQLARVKNVAGATVLGSGQVIPILNVADLMQSAVRVAAAIPIKIEKRKTDDIETAKKSILLVEDSVTSRMLLKGILESAGFAVKTAVDGVEAFTTLKTQPFDLVVSDIEMPRMNGFDLTAKIRDDQELADVPVVLVTSLEAREHRERGIEVGANAYIIKSSFDQSNLLEVTQRLI